MELLYIFGAVVFVNCTYYLLFSIFAFSKTSQKEVMPDLPISLLICAKNEAKNLTKHIPLWLNQNHQDFELILINDASTDDTLEVMVSFAEQDSRIKIVDVKNNEAFWGSKKYALTLGIKRAKNEHFIFSDADCLPASENWLALMAANFSKEKQLVLGYGGYTKKAGILNRLIRFETLMTAVQYLSYARAGIPYMGVGRNLGYTSTLYYDNRGFMNHIKIPSGDDDLFVNDTATSHNTALCVSPEAFTYSLPKTTWKDWFRQKQRHYSTARYYKSKHKFLLGLYSLSQILFWVLIPFMLLSDYWEYGLALLIFRFLIQYIVIGKTASKLRENALIVFIPFLELFLIICQMTIFISKRNKKQVRWK